MRRYVEDQGRNTNGMSIPIILMRMNTKIPMMKMNFRKNRQRLQPLNPILVRLNPTLQMDGHEDLMVFGGGKISKMVAGGTKMQTVKLFNTSDASFL